jgi:hypothetical protein
MQLDHDAGDTVIMARCNGANYQKWEVVIDPSSILETAEILSQWNPSLCLTYNRDHAWLDAIPCNGAWYQHFVS